MQRIDLPSGSGFIELPDPTLAAPLFAGGSAAPAGRVGDRANIAADAHGCPACPHPGLGPALQGSPNVFINGKSAVRVGDPGVHRACCGPNKWSAEKGSLTVWINGQPASRKGDSTRHCGGPGKLIEGSSNVLFGGASVGRADIQYQLSRPQIRR